MTLLVLALSPLLVPTDAVARAPTVAARLAVGGIVVPREHPVVRVRVSSRVRNRVRLRLADAHGHTLGRSRLLRLRAHRGRKIRLALTAAGRLLLGRCGRARVTLVVRVASGRGRRVRARTTPDTIRCAPLRWPPPALDHPQTIDLADGFDAVHLQPGRDYVLRLSPGRKVGGTFVEGGRNVVLIGGHVSVPTGTTKDEQRRALYFKDQTGTVHVEGVLIDGSAGGEADGIALNAPQATVQIEDVRIVDLHGSQRGTHADVVQPWGGVRELRIDRLTGSSHFQGLQVPVALGPIGAAFIRYANLRALPPGAPGQGGGHMLWLTAPGTCSGYTLALEHVYVAARPGRALRNSVWPGVGDGSPCAAVQQGSAVHWPGLPVRGEVRAGAPAGGDYVPAASVGERYRSPGYAVAGAVSATPFAAFVTTLQTLGCLAAAPVCALSRRPA